MAAAGGVLLLSCHPHPNLSPRPFFFFRSIPADHPKSLVLLPWRPITISIPIATHHYSSSSASLTSAACCLPSSSPSPSNSSCGTPLGDDESWAISNFEENERRAASVERLWQQFFVDPSQWWDKTFDEVDPKAPDFEHKITKTALWIHDRFTPSWLQIKLATLTQQASQRSSSSSTASSSSSSLSSSSTTCCIASGQASRTKHLWKEFFLDPSQWWDNRSEYKNSRSPDFKHKTANKELWIGSRFNPPWVNSRLASMVQGQQQVQPNPSTSKTCGTVDRLELLWLEFFSDPSQWWDNRLTKVLI